MRRVREDAVSGVDAWQDLASAVDDGLDVLVAATRQIDEHDRSGFQRRYQLHRVRDGVRRLERRQDTFQARECFEAVERFGVRDMGVLRTTEIAEPRMLRPDGGVIEAGRNGMRQLDIARLVL